MMSSVVGHVSKIAAILLCGDSYSELSAKWLNLYCQNECQNVCAGGSYRSWKRRYFILRKSTLSYFAAEGDKKPKGVIDLTHGRGVRSKEQCQLEEEEWPVVAVGNLAFGVAVEERTFHVYGCDQAAVE